MLPPQSFEEWAEQNNVPLENKHTAHSKHGIFRFVIACCSFLLIIFSFTIIFKPYETKPTDTPPKAYSTSDVTQKIIDLDTLYQKNDLILFDYSSIIYTEKTTIELAKDNEELILSYNMHSALIGIADSAYIVDYTARVYSNYSFFGMTSFSAMQELIIISDTVILYNHKSEVSFIQFSKNNVDYFLTITNLNIGMPLQNADLILLINSLRW